MVSRENLDVVETIVHWKPKPTGSFNTYGSWSYVVITDSMKQEAPRLHRDYYEFAEEGIVLTYKIERGGSIWEQQIMCGCSVPPSPFVSEEDELAAPAAGSSGSVDTLVCAVAKCALPFCTNARLKPVGHSTTYTEQHMRRCSNCLRTYYCHDECSRADWPRHRRECKPPTEAKRQIDNLLMPMLARSANMAAMRELAARFSG